MKTKEELLKIYSSYLPYELDIEVYSDSEQSRFVKMVAIDTDEIFTYMREPESWYISGLDVKHNMRGNYGILECKPILYDLSWLTREITHKGESFIPIEKFEIGDDDSGIEYDHGNIRLIKDLESISKYNSYHDIQFLPFEVVQRLIEWHFNVFSLPDELIVRVTEDFNPYK